MISLRARAVRFVTRQIFKKISPDSEIQPARELMEKLAAKSRPARGTSVQRETIAGIDCEWLVPKHCDQSRIFLYIHGGAYVVGSSKTHRTMVSHIAKQAGVRALLPNYRLAPEDPFPAGLDDCLKVYRDLIASGVNPEQIVIGGDSAGGGMTMAMLLSLRDVGHPLPIAACLLSPWLDLAAEGESVKTRAGLDPWFRADEMGDASKHYCLADQVRDPLVSPVYGDMRGLPPVLVQVGDHEILLSDSTRLVDKITAAGGQATLQIWPEMWHVFQYFVGKMPESKRAICVIGKFLNEHLERSSQGSRSNLAA